MAANPADVIRKVRNASDYFAVLEVSRNATSEEINRAYKKRAIVLHPDKCKLPGAEEAFKKCAAAKDTLLDPTKRKVYTQHGAEGLQQHESGGSPRARPNQYHQQQHGYMNEADIFEEMFASLFGGATRTRMYRQQQQRQQHYQQQQQQHQRQHQQQGQGRRQGDAQGGHPAEINMGLFMLIPILLFMLMNFALSMSPSSGSEFGSRSRGYDNVFSLVRNARRGFVIMRSVDSIPEIGDASVNYFVRGDFADALRRSGVTTRSIELQIVRDHRESLGRRCQAELQKWSRRSARGAARPTPCMEFDKFRHVPAV